MLLDNKIYPIGVSVIVCCYNSEKRLPDTLRFLANQKISQSLPCEVIIIDNLSSDSTAQTALNEWSKYKTEIIFRVIAENKKGLRFAKQRGVRESTYNTIIFCDDDNWLCENYIQLTFDALASDPTIGAIGGHGQVTSDALIPGWFPEYSRYYACYPQATNSGLLSGGQSFLYGAGMGMRKDVANFLLVTYPHLILTGRSGETLSSGEDNEFCYIIRLLDYKLWYSDKLQFYHFIPEQRLTKKYLYSLVESIAYSSMRLIIYHYVLSGKRVKRYTWLVDFVYRVYQLFTLGFRTFFIDHKFERKITLTKAWSSLLAIVDQFGQYRKTYNSVLALKKW